MAGATVTDAPEAKVIASAVAGDHRSFERLIGRWEGEVLNLAYRLTGNLEDAQDIRQTAFVRAYCALADFDGRSRFSTWLFRIVVNLCRDHRRRRQTLFRTWRTATELPVPGGSAETPDHLVQRQELGALVAKAVMDLSRAQREVLVLRHYHQLPMSDIAGILDLPTTTARSRLAQALMNLRARLGDGDQDSFPNEESTHELR